MNFSMLDNILRIRSTFTSRTKYCIEFSTTQSMYEKFYSNIMYSKHNENKSVPSSEDNCTDEDNTIDVFHEITLSDNQY